MSISEKIDEIKQKHGKFLFTTILPVLVAVFGTIFAVYQYYEAAPDLKVEVESIKFTDGGVSLFDRKVDVRSVATIVKLHSNLSSQISGDRALLPYLISIRELDEFIEILESKVKSIRSVESEVSALSEQLSNAINAEDFSRSGAKKLYESDIGKELISFVGLTIFGDDFEYRRFRSFDGAINLISSRRFEFNPEDEKFKHVASENIEEEIDEEIELLVKLIIEKYVSKSSLKSDEKSEVDKEQKQKQKQKQKQNDFTIENSVNQLLLASKTLLPNFVSQKVIAKKDGYKGELKRAKEIRHEESKKVDNLNKKRSRLEVSSIIMNLGSQGTAIRPYGILRIQLNANSRITIPLSVESKNSTNISSSGVTKVVLYSEDRESASKLLDKVDGALNKDVESILVLQDIQDETHLSKKTHISYQTFKESIIEDLTVEAHKVGY